MARFFLRIGLIASLALAAAQATASDTLRMTLKPKATVSGENILFADIFNGAPARIADLPLAASPEPGQTVNYDAAFLIRAVRRHGVDWRPTSRFVETSITRSAIRVSADEALSAVANALKKKGGIAGELELKVESPIADAYLPAGSAVKTDIVDVNYDRRSNRFRAGVVLSGGGVTERFDVYGRAYEVLMAPTPNRNIGRGERITRADLTLTPVRADKIPPDAALRAEELIGMDVNRVIRAGMVVRQSDVTPAVMIERGAIVAIVFKTPAMTLTSQGRALENGATGSTIRVSNTQTNRVVHARVVAPNEVRVYNAAQLANR